MPDATFTIGTRGSDLALAQATLVRDALKLARPGLEINTRVIHTTGDKRLDLKLSGPTDAGGEKVPKGLFTKELEIALSTGEIDVAVHSLKDLPTEMPRDLVWAATLPRERVEDVLVTKAPPPPGARGLNFLPTGALVTTSSVRRACLLQLYRPDLALDEIRGNVPTRLRKLAEHPEMAATVLAYAGLHRLGFLREESGKMHLPDGLKLYATVLDAGVFMPAVGQGAIGLQARREDDPILRALDAINHRESYWRAQAERAFLQALGGSCQTPVGVHTRLEGNSDSGESTLILRCLVFPENAPAGSSPFRGSLFAPPQSAEDLGRELAKEARAAFRTP